MNIFAKLAFAAVLGALAIPGVAAAQDSATTKQVNGNVMNSHAGGEYDPLTPGEQVASGDAIMVSPDSSAVLTVTDGTRTWEVVLPPGTYRITPGLLRTAGGQTLASQSRGNLVMSVGVIVGTAALVAGALKNMDEVPPVRPVSQ